MEQCEIKRFLNRTVYYLLSDDKLHEYIFNGCMIRNIGGKYEYFAELLDPVSNRSVLNVRLADVVAKETADISKLR